MSIHGGNIYKYSDVLDFSANISPYDSSFIREAVIASADMWKHYPDSDCTELAAKIGGYERIGTEHIVCGNGAADLIYRTVYALRPKKALVLAPTFTEYEKALREADCCVMTYRLPEKNGFVPREDLLDMIDGGTDMVFICTPNNPTGKVFPKDLLFRLADVCSAHGTVLMSDECFMEFVLPESRAPLREHFGKNCIYLRAFTKIFAIPGLRLGYAVFGDRETAERVRSHGQCWSVSVPAQTAGIAALEHIDEIRDIAERTAQQREYLYGEMDAAGVEYIRSDANFILFRGDKGLGDRMIERGIMIRCCDDMCEGYYRTAVRTYEENTRFSAALRECVNG